MEEEKEEERGGEGGGEGREEREEVSPSRLQEETSEVNDGNLEVKRSEERKGIRWKKRRRRRNDVIMERGETQWKNTSENSRRKLNYERWKRTHSNRTEYYSVLFYSYQ